MGIMDEVLLARNCSDSKPEISGKWEFPGGKIELGEQPEEALVREIEEELGCTVSIERLVHAQNNIYSDGMNALVLFYWCKVAHGEPRGDIIWESLAYIKEHPGMIGPMVLPGVLAAVGKWRG